MEPPSRSIIIDPLFINRISSSSTVSRSRFKGNALEEMGGTNGGEVLPHSYSTLGSTDIRKRENRILTKKTWDLANKDPHLIRLGKYLAYNKGFKNTNCNIENKLEKIYLKEVKNTNLIIHRVINPDMRVAAFIQVWSNKSSSHDKCQLSKIINKGREKKAVTKVSTAECRNIPGLSDCQQEESRDGKSNFNQTWVQVKKERRGRETAIFSWIPKPTEQHKSLKAPKAPKSPKPKHDLTYNQCRVKVNKVIRRVLKSRYQSKTERKARSNPKTPIHPNWNGKRNCESEKPQTRKSKTHSFGSNHLPRYKGGMEYNTNLDDMVNIAIQNAAQHQPPITLEHLIPTPGDGNCVFTAALKQLNHRSCFPEKLFATADELRQAIVTTLQSSDTARLRSGYRLRQWEKELSILKKSGKWNIGLGDIIPGGIALTAQKNILIYHTKFTLRESPTSVVLARDLGGEADTHIPIVLAYNGVHYEGLVPRTEDDVIKTVQLVQQHKNGTYDTKVTDIPVFSNERKRTYQLTEENPRKRVASLSVYDLPTNKGVPQDVESLNIEDTGTIFKYEHPNGTCTVELKVYETGEVQCPSCNQMKKQLIGHLKKDHICKENVTHIELTSFQDQLKKYKDIKHHQIYRIKERAKDPEAFKEKDRKNTETYRIKERAKDPEAVKEKDRKR